MAEPATVPLNRPIILLGKVNLISSLTTILSNPASLNTSCISVNSRGFCRILGGMVCRGREGISTSDCNENANGAGELWVWPSAGVPLSPSSMAKLTTLLLPLAPLPPATFSSWSSPWLGLGRLFESSVGLGEAGLFLCDFSNSDSLAKMDIKTSSLRDSASSSAASASSCLSFVDILKAEIPLSNSKAKGRVFTKSDTLDCILLR